MFNAILQRAMYMPFLICLIETSIFWYSPFLYKNLHGYFATKKKQNLQEHLNDDKPFPYSIIIFFVQN